MAFLRLLLQILLLLGIASCSTVDPTVYYSRIQGTVQNEATSAPVPDVHILVTWRAQFGTHSISWVCTWIATAQTDEQGKFSIIVDPSRMAAYNNGAQREMRGGFPEIRLYKPGMTVVPKGNMLNGLQVTDNADAIRKRKNSLLPSRSPFEVTTTVNGFVRQASLDSHERIRDLFMLSRQEPDCANYQDSASIHRFHDALKQEAASIASTVYEKSVADIIAVRAKSPAGTRGPFTEDYEAIRAFACDSSVDSDCRDSLDRTPLMNAALAGNVERVAALLDAGANPNRTTFSGDGINNGYNVLTLAIEKRGYPFNKRSEAGNDAEVVRTLLSHKSTDPDGRNRNNSYTPLMMAVMRGQYDIVDLLLNAGANPDIIISQETALSLAEKNLNTLDAKTRQPDPIAVKVYELVRGARRIHAR